MVKSSGGWWKGRKGKVLETGPAQSSRRWAERALEKINANQDPESLLVQYEKNLDRQIKIHGVDSGPAANARNRLAGQLEKMDRWDEARLFREQAFDAYRRNRGLDDRYTLEAEEWLAVTLARCGLREHATSHIEHVIEERTRTLGPDDEVTAQSVSLGRNIRDGGT